MGLGAFRTAWKRQTKYFGHDRSDRYSVLVLDNRGMGLSDKPACRYSTSEMARDIIELLQHVDWLPSPLPTLYDMKDSPPKRDLHIVGISMGGMMAQELALIIPNHIASLSLISTASRLVRTLPFVENLRARINMFIPRDLDVQLDEIAHRLFPDEWLAQPDTENGDDEKKSFPTNFDRFAAAEIQKRSDKAGFTKKGFTLQAVAAGWHFKSTEQIKQIGDGVGRERICVVHGTQDRMITFEHFRIFKEQFGGEDCGVEFKVWEGKGHVLVWEVENDFNEFMEWRFEMCENMGT